MAKRDIKIDDVSAANLPEDLQINDSISFIKELLRSYVCELKYRQTCNNQPELNEISKAKAHIYGICAEEIKTIIKQVEAKMNELYCPYCAELLIDDPVCSDCGEVAGLRPEMYRLHPKIHYLNLQIRKWGEVKYEIKNWLNKEK